MNFDEANDYCSALLEEQVVTHKHVQKTNTS